MISFFSNESLIEAYRMMLLIRRFEEKSAQLYGMGVISGFCHLYIGQEAVVVGVQFAMNPCDTMITGYRDHGHMLVCGMDPNRVMAELAGRQSGYSKGKGGSMHMFSKEKNFYGGHGIVGGQVSIGTGIAFAHKYKNEKAVCLTYFGDGAANQGQVYESFNIASLWKLPVIYIIEDNGYAMGTAVHRASSNPEFIERAKAFHIPGKIVDGMDVLAVREAAEWAVSRTRSGEGPSLLHIKTYRYRGHSMSDPAQYRTHEEVEHMKKNFDPIKRLYKVLLEKNICDENAMKDIDKEVKLISRNAGDFAQKAPVPEHKELYTDVAVKV
ncbi:MAG: pyruvate dehydrogenase (acetyl-transferring) E1 component subunit alpha [Alphaproteobacteria bacterium]